MHFAMILFPWLLVLVFTIMLNNEVTAALAWWILSENKPVEILTFIFAFLSAGLGMTISWLLFSRNQPTWHIFFYIVFSLVMLFIAMEEIAWGQHFFSFETPELMRHYNAQGEFTFHNIGALQQHNEWLRLALGVSVGIGIYLNRFAYFKKIAVPTVLTGWVILIVTHSLIDIFNDHIPIQQQFDLTIRFLSEVFELLISMLALIYITIKLRENRTTTIP